MKTSALVAVLSFGMVAGVRAQTTAFSYQGRLTDAGSPANGTYDLRFIIYDSGGVPVTSALTNAATVVSNGFFSVLLDFGTGPFSGAGDRFLDIGVRTNGSSRPYVSLSPRQQFTAAPFALRAAYTGAVQDSQLSPNIARLDASQTYTGGVSFNNAANQFAGTFVGSGAGLTSLPVGGINVKDFGAKGDGFTDDSAAIMAAFNLWLVKGGTLYFPAGRYLDKNTYDIGGQCPAIVWNVGSPLRIQGAGKAVTLWMAAITNQVFMAGSTVYPDLSDISVANCGSGSNCFFICRIGGPLGPSWERALVQDFAIGANFSAVSCGRFIQVDFENCYIGLKVPGFCDSWNGTLVMRSCTNGLVIGGEEPQLTIEASGHQWYLMGNNNYIGCVILSGTTIKIAGGLESQHYCTIHIGRPSTLPQGDDSHVGNVICEGLYALDNPSQALIRLTTNCSSLLVSGCFPAMAPLVKIDRSGADLTPMTLINNLGGAAVQFSDGTQIPVQTGVQLVNHSIAGYSHNVSEFVLGPDGNLSMAGAVLNPWITGGVRLSYNNSGPKWMGVSSYCSPNGDASILGVGHEDSLGGPVTDDLTIKHTGEVKVRQTLTIGGTTNQVTFGATNTAPTEGRIVETWISVQVQGQTNVYRLPLYK